MRWTGWFSGLFQSFEVKLGGLCVSIGVIGMYILIGEMIPVSTIWGDFVMPTWLLIIMLLIGIIWMLFCYHKGSTQMTVITLSLLFALLAAIMSSQTPIRQASLTPIFGFIIMFLLISVGVELIWCYWED